MGIKKFFTWVVGSQQIRKHQPWPVVFLIGLHSAKKCVLRPLLWRSALSLADGMCQVLVKKVNPQQAQPSKGRPETEECRYCCRPFKKKKKKKTVRFHSAKGRRGRRVALGDKLVFTKDKASPERAGGSHLSKPKRLPRDFSPPSAFGSAAPDRRTPEAGMGFRSLPPPPPFPDLGSRPRPASSSSAAAHMQSGAGGGFEA